MTGARNGPGAESAPPEVNAQDDRCALRVAIAAPARLNPYPALLHRAVVAADPALHCALWRDGLSWRELLGGGRPQVLHLHWLELLYQHYGPTGQRLLLWLNLLLYVTAARLLGTRLVYTVHNVWQHEESGRRLYSIAHRWVLRLASAVHVHDDAAKEQLLEQGRCRAPVVVIPHGNYITWYDRGGSRETARERLGLAADAFVYLSLGQVRAYKGLEGLLEAFSALPGDEIVLIIAGRPSGRELAARLQAQAVADPRLRLHLYYVPDEELQWTMNAADVAVLPYRRSTTSGAAILALSFGLPVIAPALGPFPALLAEGAGFLYDPQRPEALTAALRAAQDADLEACRHAARARAESLDWAPIGQQLARLYRKVGGGP
jgi:beta-1,4-mannosyltransferase